LTRVVLIVGLCGSGKTYLATELESQGFVCLDESFGGIRFSADPGKLLSTGKSDELERQLMQGMDCAFTEAMLMFEQGRQEFEPCLKRLRAMKDTTIEWVYFANDPDSANHNCRNDPNRSDGEGRVALNVKWCRSYRIPHGHTPRAIVKIPTKKTN
jgi:hypothetical protein